LGKENSGAKDKNTLSDGRRPYSKPQLVRYGAVEKLTQSGGATKAEGGRQRSRPS
jgi:hypothetical protein